ncbi:hypothetical protein J2S09_002387 [Bacillus fengqiuensis]|nr:hypothetical protein [Bacillus fengqiuensis]
MKSQFSTYLDIQRDAEEDKIELQKVDKILTIGLMSILLIIPLLVRPHVAEYISPLITDHSVLDTGMHSDVFTYYKYFLLVGFTIILSLVFIYKVTILNYQIAKTKLNVLIAILYMAIILSAIFSPYKMLALTGMYDRHDGTITYLCYLTLFFIAANIQYSERKLKWVLYCLYPFVIVNIFLGMATFLGYDILKISWIKNIFLFNLPEGAQVGEGSIFRTTINHGNYISGASAVITLLFLTWALFDNNKIRAAVNIIISLLSFTTILTSLSVSGFLTLICMLPLLGLLFVKIERKLKSAIILVVFFIGSSVTYLTMVNHNSKVWDETFGFVIKQNPFVEGKGFENVGRNVTNFLGPTKALAESNSANEGYELPKLPESGIGAGSGRLYIWKETFKLIQERPLFGYGLDTLQYSFPQDDPMKHANIETYKVIVDKPHNMFIGIAYGIGIVGFIAFLGIILLALGATIKALIKTKVNSPVFIATAMAIIAYLFQALFNDSIIGSTIIFWILLGTLVALLNNEQETEVR